MIFVNKKWVNDLALEKHVVFVLYLNIYKIQSWSLGGWKATVHGWNFLVQIYGIHWLVSLKAAFEPYSFVIICSCSFHDGSVHIQLCSLTSAPLSNHWP